MAAARALRGITIVLFVRRNQTDSAGKRTTVILQYIANEIRRFRRQRTVRMGEGAVMNLFFGTLFWENRKTYRAVWSVRTRDEIL